MNISHFTNTFLPHVGGVARAVQTLLEDQRKSGHKVLVVAPEFSEGKAPKFIERSVTRIPAFTRFNNTDFSVRIPMAATFSDEMNAFEANVIHSHHPFLLGDTALREASARDIPVIFTHHTLYEQYTHYLPVEWSGKDALAAKLATRYANRCSAVIAPSESIKKLITGRGVEQPVFVVPTGIETKQFREADGILARKRWKIPSNATVIGHLGRLAKEKNLAYLAEAISRSLRKIPDAYALIVGKGPEKDTMEKILKDYGVMERAVFTGALTGKRLRDTYKAMDFFVFSSQSETQGLVINEAMAAGNAVFALDGPGVREVINDNINGRLLTASTTAEGFARILFNANQKTEIKSKWKSNALKAAKRVDRSITNKQMLQVYSQVTTDYLAKSKVESFPDSAIPAIKRVLTEGYLIADRTGAIIDVLSGKNPKPSEIK